MTDNERDTHFQGFAELQWDTLLAELDKRLGMTLRLTPSEQKIVKDIFAQRAYDLALHVLEHDPIDLADLEAEDALSTIPDLTQWPDLPTPE